MSKLSIRDLDLKDKRVFIRVDFNVPLAPGGQEITSDKRIRASLPTIKYALEHGAGVNSQGVDRCTPLRLAYDVKFDIARLNTARI